MKLGVLDRYLCREVGLTGAAIATVLMAVLLINYLVRLMSVVAGGELPASAIFSLLGLTTLASSAPLLPAALFLAVVLSFGRLYRDNEMAVLTAVGVSPWRLYRTLLLLALPVALLVGWLAVWGAPDAQREMEALRAEAQRTLEIESLRAGRFLTSQRARGMVYMQDLGPDGEMSEIFLQTEDEGQLVLVTAERARLRLDEETGERFLTLEDGWRYEGVPGSAQWRVVRFAEHGLRVGEPPAPPPRFRRRSIPVEVLLAVPTRDHQIELQWRLSMPLMALVLTWIAVPLSKAEPREGRYAKLVSAVLVFAIYLNLLKAAQDWARDGSIAVSLGLWWVHGVMFAFGAVLLARRYGLLRRRAST